MSRDNLPTAVFEGDVVSRLVGGRFDQVDDPLPSAAEADNGTEHHLLVPRPDAEPGCLVLAKKTFFDLLLILLDVPALRLRCGRRLLEHPLQGFQPPREEPIADDLPG